MLTSTTFGLIACLLTSLPFVHSAALVSNLTQSKTNGKTALGTVNAPHLPPYLATNRTYDGIPPSWDGKTPENNDPYEEPPVTNVTRSFHFVIQRGQLAPDGVNKSMILINGAFPGPLIEANWGDMINVTVDNQILDEGTSLHWHGFLQKETPWYDGVPSVQQCPIAPGQSFTYSFKADLYGTSWYHSHFSAQYADGLLGPMVVHGVNGTDTSYDVDLGPILLNDWYYDDYYKIVKDQLTPLLPTEPFKAPPFSDNNLINGKGNANCTQVAEKNASLPCVPNAGLSKFVFKRGLTHRLRLINAGAEALQRFTIDNHVMTVIANDFVPVEPYDTTVVTLGVGQRTDILVTANDNTTGAVWMRSDISTTCSATNRPHALAAIYYDDADTSIAPTTIATPYEDNHCGNDPLNMTIPERHYNAPETPDVTQEIDITVGLNKTSDVGNNGTSDVEKPVVQLFFMNGVSFRGNYDFPLLNLAHSGNTSYPDDPQWNVYNFGQNTSIRIVLNNLTPISHPMHLHGHNFYVLAEGLGNFTGEVNTGNVQRRDTQLVQPNGYLVIEFVTDNPGVWPFHCHIAWHVSSGLYVNILERPDLITQPQIPTITDQTCDAWHDFSANNFVNQIDSGLRLRE